MLLNVYKSVVDNLDICPIIDEWTNKSSYINHCRLVSVIVTLNVTNVYSIVAAMGNLQIKNNINSTHNQGHSHHSHISGKPVFLIAHSIIFHRTLSFAYSISTKHKYNFLYLSLYSSHNKQRICQSFARHNTEFHSISIYSFLNFTLSTL